MKKALGLSSGELGSRPALPELTGDIHESFSFSEPHYYHLFVKWKGLSSLVVCGSMDLSNSGGQAYSVCCTSKIREELSQVRQ